MPTEARVHIIAGENEGIKRLRSELTRISYKCSIAHDEAGLAKLVAERLPDLVLVEMDSRAITGELTQTLKLEKSLPIIALINRESIDNVDSYPDVDDFLISPYDTRELVLRIKRLLRGTRNDENNELIKCDGLEIDPGKYEVTLGGKPVELTFREYELLKFLASNRGHVYTREALLNRVWGYDYFGGDRTVDVHIRRLRSKTEDSIHTFIETVRNIGYRFKDI